MSKGNKIAIGRALLGRACSTQNRRCSDNVTDHSESNDDDDDDDYGGGDDGGDDNDGGHDNDGGDDDGGIVGTAGGAQTI